MNTFLFCHRRYDARAYGLMLVGSLVFIAEFAALADLHIAPIVREVIRTSGTQKGKVIK